jgi:5,10-methylenetetrahydromethanopterin reductase
VCDGVFGVDAPFDGFFRRVFAVHGTVLEAGETLDDERVRDAAGPAVAMRVRYLWTFRRRSDLLSLAGGAEWIAAVEGIPEERRALELFGGYFGPRSPLDAAVINPTSISELTLTGTREEVADRLEALRRLGATEFAYRPSGPDVRRELAAFADAARPAAS